MLLHIGYHKTGTSWMQHHFFPKAAEFSVIAEHAEVDELFVRPHCLHFSPSTVRAKLNRRIEVARERGLIPVISSELLCGNPFFGSKDSVVLARRLKSVFPEAKILITLREQIAMVCSLYTQYLKRGGTLNAEGFLQADRIMGYDGFDARHLEYHNLVEFYQDLFGHEQVEVLPYEDLRDSPIEFCRMVYEFSGKDTPTTWNWLSTDRVGLSPSGRVLPLLRILNQFRTSPLNPRPVVDIGPVAHLVGKGWQKIDRKFFNGIRDHNRDSIKCLVSELYGDRYQSSNLALSELVGFDLSKKGYAISKSLPSDHTLKIKHSDERELDHIW